MYQIKHYYTLHTQGKEVQAAGLLAAPLGPVPLALPPGALARHAGLVLQPGEPLGDPAAQQALHIADRLLANLRDKEVV